MYYLGMKKKYLLIATIILVLAMLTSCVSSVKINTMIPSTVDLTGYSSIRIEDPSVKGVFMSRDKNSIVSLTKDMIAKALSEGPYTVVVSGKADAVLSSEVVIDTGRCFVATEKTDAKDKDGATIYKYILKQSAYLTFRYYLRDFRTGSVIDTYSTKVGMPSYGYAETILGESTDPDDFSFKYMTYVSDYIGGYDEAIKSLKDTIVKRLVPHYQTVTISLMENKPEVEGLKSAYDAVDQGLYKEALVIFDKTWERNGYIQSGYNSALLMYATGNQKQAIARAYEVWEKTGSEKALSLYSKLTGMNADDILAKKQSGIKVK